MRLLARMIAQEIRRRDDMLLEEVRKIRAVVENPPKPQKKTETIREEWQETIRIRIR